MKNRGIRHFPLDSPLIHAVIWLSFQKIPEDDRREVEKIKARLLKGFGITAVEGQWLLAVYRRLATEALPEPLKPRQWDLGQKS